jgi:PhzF family phenazine biosynthesis protein
VRVYHVDAFTSRPFAGNPAGVCLLQQAADPAWMHTLAVELNLPKTAFVLRQGAGGNCFDLRWFGFDGEAQLCGHATLAAAHVLWENGMVAAANPIEFSTLSGTLVARRAGQWIELDFPAEPAAAEHSQALVEALGIEPLWMGRNRLHHLIELANEDAVRSLRPDFVRIAAASPPAHGVIVTARAATPDIDFVSRVFVPLAGVNEDPATGSAHCALGPYWAAKLGKKELLALQVSARGGSLRVRVAGDRVHIAGQAVSLLCCQLVGGRAA